jgi:Ca2+-binding RTX toxin-like protein
LGNDAINRINGGDGCDVIFGRGGNDTLIGEAGNDILNGGSGNDVFIFSEGDGNDIIEDFEAGAGRTDRLRLLDSSFEDFEDVQSALTDTEDGALLTLDNGSILLQNLNSADLVADDFILG